MNGGYCFYPGEKQSLVIVQIFTMEKGVKNFFDILENASGKCVHQMFS